MRLLHYLEIRNFKRFGETERIDLGHPTVLIGPNNCGKNHGHPGDLPLVAGVQYLVRQQGQGAGNGDTVTGPPPRGPHPRSRDKPSERKRT